MRHSYVDPPRIDFKLEIEIKEMFEEMFEHLDLLGSIFDEFGHSLAIGMDTAIDVVTHRQVKRCLLLTDANFSTIKKALDRFSGRVFLDPAIEPRPNLNEITYRVDGIDLTFKHISNLFVDLYNPQEKYMKGHLKFTANCVFYDLVKSRIVDTMGGLHDILIARELVTLKEYKGSKFSFLDVFQIFSMMARGDGMELSEADFDSLVREGIKETPLSVEIQLEINEFLKVIDVPVLETILKFTDLTGLKLRQEVIDNFKSVTEMIRSSKMTWVVKLVCLFDFTDELTVDSCNLEPGLISQLKFKPLSQIQIYNELINIAKEIYSEQEEQEEEQEEELILLRRMSYTCYSNRSNMQGALAVCSFLAELNGPVQKEKVNHFNNVFIANWGKDLRHMHSPLMETEDLEELFGCSQYSAKLLAIREHLREMRFKYGSVMQIGQNNK